MLACSALLPILALAAEPVRVGVLAFRHKPQTLEQWKPLAAVLKQAIPERDFVVEVYTFPELEAAVAGRKLDFVLTNPGHYVLMAKRIGLSAPLATLSVDQGGKPFSVFGGVIFCRAQQAAIETLGDIRGKTIAATSTDSFGGYQVQAYELVQAGIRLPQDAKLSITGMPHDKVVEAVLDGEADVGFVRTGVLEAMAAEGKLDLSRLKILKNRNFPEFSQLSSTRLYPEWAFSVLPNVEGSLARHVAAALYVLEDNTAAVRAMNIHGFVVPPDYTPVADLLKELRLPPFDEGPKFTLQDVWARYRWQIIGALLVSGLFLLLSFRLILTRRKLSSEHHIVLLQKQQLQESEARLQAIFESEPECIKIVDAQGRLKLMNPAGLEMIQASSLEQVIDRPITGVIAPEYREAFTLMHQRVLAGEAMQMEFEVQGLKGGNRWLETHAVPMQDKGETVQLAVTRDISQRKLMEQQVHQLAFYDSLTNLPNRRLLNDRLSQCLNVSKRSACHGALMFLDLDNFKPLNDTYGHMVGDLLLVEVAHRLRHCVREVDTVARFGGDEFVVMLNELDVRRDESITQARRVAEKILASLAAPYLLHIKKEDADDRVEHRCSASIGVVVFIDHEGSESDIIKWADAAMYLAKESGRNSIRFYQQPEKLLVEPA